MEALDPPKDGKIMPTSTPELAQTPTNCKCRDCGDVFGKPTQVRRHLIHKHGAHLSHWDYTNEPKTRKDPDWKQRLAATEANKAAVGPFQCKYCDFPPVDSIKAVAAHIGHMHKKGGGPFMVGRDFLALGTAQGPRASRGPYKKRKPKQPVGSRIKQAVMNGKPTITLDFDLSDDITIRVPLVLGPPTFIERENRG